MNINTAMLIIIAILLFFACFILCDIRKELKNDPQQIKENAPYGATHYDRDHDYLKLHQNKWSVWNSSHEIWQPMRRAPTEEAMTRLKIKPL